MSDIHDDNGPPSDDVIAAEYALGVLDGGERAAAERRIASDARFARLVTEWEERLAPWAEEIAEETPSPALWTMISARLPASAAAAEPARAGMWQSLSFWRTFALAATLAAACLALFVYVNTSQQGEPLMAAIEAAGKRSFVATLDPKRGTVTVVPVAFSGDSTHVPELWLVPAGGKPIPVGLLEPERTVILPLPAALRAQATGGATLAVSLEPPGGSPTGAPAGPVIGAGKLTSL